MTTQRGLNAHRPSLFICQISFFVLLLSNMPGQKRERKVGENGEKGGAEFAEKSREELIKMIQELQKREMEASRQSMLFSEQLEGLRKENWELRFDELTGLERRQIFFTKINNKLEKIIQDEEIREILAKEELSPADIEKLKKVALAITFLDLGYLSKYNEDPEITKFYGGGHGGGDEILSKTGALVQEIDSRTQKIKPKLGPDVSGYRLGGDEFGLIHYSTKDKAEEAVKEFRVKHREIKIKGADLPTAINAGTADFADAVKVFMIAYSQEEREEMDEETKYKSLQKFLTNVADLRAKYDKVNERIDMIVKLQKDPEIFRRNFTYLQKGALRLGQEKFQELLQIKEKDLNEFQRVVEQLIGEGLEFDHKEAVAQEERAYRATIQVALGGK